MNAAGQNAAVLAALPVFPTLAAASAAGMASATSSLMDGVHGDAIGFASRHLGLPQGSAHSSEFLLSASHGVAGHMLGTEPSVPARTFWAGLDNAERKVALHLLAFPHPGRVVTADQASSLLDVIGERSPIEVGVEVAFFEDTGVVRLFTVGNEKSVPHRTKNGIIIAHVHPEVVAPSSVFGPREPWLRVFPSPEDLAGVMTYAQNVFCDRLRNPFHWSSRLIVDGGGASVLMSSHGGSYFTWEPPDPHGPSPFSTRFLVTWAVRPEFAVSEERHDLDTALMSTYYDGCISPYHGYFFQQVDFEALRTLVRQRLAFG